MSIHQDNKDLVKALWAALDAATLDGDKIAAFWQENAPYKAMEPVGHLSGGQSVFADFWQPLRAAMSDFSRETHILMAGASQGKEDEAVSEGNWVGATGYFHCKQAGSFLGLPAGPKSLRIRWGEFLKIEDGKIVDGQFQLDLVDWAEQLGINLMPPSTGTPFVWPAPTAISGLDFPVTDADTAQTMELGRGLIFGGLNVFDEDALESMGMRKFFHENLKWYGPGGVNACLSLKEFEDYHQEPWLRAFPDRKVKDLESLFAEGRFVAGSGIAGVHATHTGPYRGHLPLDGKLEVSGLDFWLRTDDKFSENWVFVDFVKLFREMGYDIMAKLKNG